VISYSCPAFVMSCPYLSSMNNLVCGSHCYCRQLLRVPGQPCQRMNDFAKSIDARPSAAGQRPCWSWSLLETDQTLQRVLGARPLTHFTRGGSHYAVPSIDPPCLFRQVSSCVNGPEPPITDPTVCSFWGSSLYEQLLRQSTNTTMATPNRGPELLAVNIAFVTTAVLACALRIYVRLMMVKAFGRDDWLMVLATVSVD
jgi:hypothetical protein